MAIQIQDLTSGAPDLKFKVSLVIFDGSYPTGGYAITPAQFELGSIIYVDATGVGTGLQVAWDRTNSKLKCFWSAAAGSRFAEVTNGSNLSTDSAVILVIGR